MKMIDLICKYDDDEINSFHLFFRFFSTWFETELCLNNIIQQNHRCIIDQYEGNERSLDDLF